MKRTHRYSSRYVAFFLVFAFLLSAARPGMVSQQVDRSNMLSDGGVAAQTIPPSPPPNDARTVPPGVRPITGQDAAGTSAPGYYDTSTYMIGSVASPTSVSVAVGLIMPESIGSGENWDGRDNDVVAEIEAGLASWNSWFTTYGGITNGLRISLPLTERRVVSTSYEPITLSSSSQGLWINETLNSLGYTSATNDYWERAYKYTDYLRSHYNTDWAFIIFVVDSLNDEDGMFADGSFAYSYLGGPFMVMTYDNETWGINWMNEVTAHETAHIFGAGDQYPESGCTTSELYGYLGIANTNCNGPVASLMRDGYGVPDITTRQQVGWRDSDSDGIFDPVDTRPAITGLSKYNGATVNSANVTYTGGIAYDNPWPHSTCCPYFVVSDVTIRSIQAVEFRIDDTDPWYDVDIVGGVLENDYELFTITTPPLSDGLHNIEVRAQNNNTDPVNQYSTLWNDTFVVDAPPRPDHDDFTTLPRAIGSVPYSDSSVNTTGATMDLDDPVSICTNYTRGVASVWYSYSPSVNTNVYFDTFGSNYDTVINIWTGTRGSLSPAGCNDNASGNQSGVALSAIAGTTYFIEVLQRQAPTPPSQPGGTLNFRARNFAEIDVYVNLPKMGTYEVPMGGSMRNSYTGINNGPARVTNSNIAPIIASQRVLFGAVSYSEMMGYPVNQLTTEYIFPWYNNTAMDSQLRVSNVGSDPTTITVYLGNNEVIDSYTLGAGEATRKNYAGRNNGPLRVTSSSSNILTTIRVLYGGLSYSELMGFPSNQLTTEYIFPWYNNTAMDSQLRVSNVGGGPTTITVYLGNNEVIDSYTLGAGEATRKNYAGRNNGPLRVTSSSSNILTTIRVLYGGRSLSELMGFPANQLTTEYWYPIYDNVSLDSQLRVSNVGSGTTTITVFVGDTQIDSYTLGAGQATRMNYASLNEGPLHVVSNPEPILTTTRMLYNTASFASLYEMTGLPDPQLVTEYWFPWYNNTAMDSQIRFAVP